MSQPYESLEAELHDHFWAAEDEDSEVALMAAFLKCHPGPALEVGSGSGRLLLPLLEMGFEIEGLELSTDMLKLCRDHAARRELRPVLHHGDMTSWRPGRQYASILAPAFTFQLGPKPEATLRHWHSLLEDSGGLYLTIFVPYAELLGELPEGEWYRDHSMTLNDGRKAWVETRHRLDRPHRLLRREHRYHLTGSVPRFHESVQMLRWFEPSEMRALLEQCGFRTTTPFADFDPRQIAEDPNRMDFDGILTYQATKV